MIRLLRYLPWPKRRPTRHSVEAILDELWISRISEMATRRREMGWA